MAFDFPAAPATGDRYQDPTSGTEYVWTGSTWDLSGGGDLSDYVLKEGDTMVGPLVVKHATDENVGWMRISPGSGAGMGLVEWLDGVAGGPPLRKAYMGWGSATRIQLQLENGVTGFDINGNIAFGSVAVTSPQDLSRHIALYSTTFGFCITGSTVNYNSSNYHQFWAGATNTMTVGSGAIELRIATNFRAATYAYGGLTLISGSFLKVPEGTAIRFHVNEAVICSTDNKAIRYGVAENSWHIFKVGADTEFNINSGGAGLLSLAPVAADLGITPGRDGTVSIAKAMIAMLAKIKALETELATLRK